MVLSPAQIEARLAPHLEPGERVVWQGAPSADTFFGVAQLGPAILLAIGGAALAAGLLDVMIPFLTTVQGPAKVVPGLAAIAAAGQNIWWNYRRRGALWAYAITDRRLLSVLGDRLIRAVPPGAITPADVKVAGRLVYWGRSPRNSDMQNAVPEWMQRGPDRPWIGFYGQDDAQGLRQRILDWRAGVTEAAAQAGRRFVAGEDRAPARPRAPEAPRGGYVHLASGVSVDLPEGWTVEVSTKSDGPLKVFGVTILPRFVREGTKSVYVPGLDWNVLHASGAPDAGVDFFIRPGPLDLTLKKVLDDPWGAATGLKLVAQEELVERPGGYRGFSVTRLIPGGGSLAAFGPVMGNVHLRQEWISNGSFTIEAQGLTPENHAVLEKTVSRIFDTLGG